MRRYLFLVTSILLMFAFIITSSDAAEKVRFATHFKINPHYGLPAIAAIEKGFWKEEGLEVERFPFDSPPTMYRAVAAGSIDVGTAGISSLVPAVAAGLPVAYVAYAGHVSRFYIWVLADSRFKQPRDLKGGKIGVTGLGQATHYYAYAVIRALGLEKEMKIVGTGGGTRDVAAVKARAVDATLLTDLAMAPLVAAGEVRALLPIEDYLPKGLTDQILYSHREFLEKKPEAVRKVVKGFFKGIVFVTGNRQWTLEKMNTDFAFSEKTAQVSYPLLRYTLDGKIDVSKIENNINFLVEYGLLAKEKVPPMDKIYVKGFAE